MKILSRVEPPMEENVPNVYEVLNEKEILIKRLRREVAALRLVVPLLHEEGDFPTIESYAVQGKPRVTALAQKWEDSSRIRPRIVDAGPMEIKKETARSALLQFTQIALGAWRRFLKRVLDSRAFEREPQRKTIRQLGPTKAA